MAIQLSGYSKSPTGAPVRDPIRFTCIGVVGGAPTEEVLVGSVSTVVPDVYGAYSSSLAIGAYRIELQQSNNEWIEQGKVIVSSTTSSPISITMLLKQYPYTSVE